MRLHSCQNCWFNGLQYGALGSPVGYCSRHKKILNMADATTCGLHFRKDLTVNRAQQVSEIHSKIYPSDAIIRIIDNEAHKEDSSTNEKDLGFLRSNPVGEVVSDFGLLGSTIESLAQLKAMNGVRAEVAMVSLARGYVNNCMSHNGKWTSGLHLYWWTKNRLADIPEIKLEDLRTVWGSQLARQSELSAWSVIMLRLTFIDDIISYASRQNDPLGRIPSLTEQAAITLDTFHLKKLSSWLRSEAIPQLDKRLSIKRYAELANELHDERAGIETQHDVQANTPKL